MIVNKENAMLVDVQYVKANRKEGLPDYLYIIWKNLDTGEKYLQKVEEPTMDIYFEKPEFRNHVNVQEYQFIDKLDKKTVKAKDIIFAIADDMGDVGKERLQTCFSTKNYNGLQEFFLYPYVYGADYDVRVLYRLKWKENFNNDRVKKITKGFLDIETDIMEAVGMPNPQISPIDLVTIIDTSTDISYTFALTGVANIVEDLSGITNQQEKKQALIKRNWYKQRLKQQDYVTSHLEELQEAVHKEFDENYPGMEYKFYFYKDERKMLIHLFQLINQLKLDFIGIWNMGFDIDYIIKRMYALGLDPKEIICHPDFPAKECYFKKDTHNFAIKNKSDFFHCSSYTVFFDQMILYAAIRKSREELRSIKLTYIAKKEIKDEKLNYSEEGSLKTLSCENYMKYILYNIKDVLLQTGIEKKTSDVDTYYIYSYNNITPYESVFKQTVKLRNVQYESYRIDGCVPGENINAFLYRQEKEKEEEDDDKKDDKFEGALVGNPVLNDDFGEFLFGKQSNAIFSFSVDMDMSAFYPNGITVFNIGASCLIFKVIVSPKQYNVAGGSIPFNGITDVQIIKSNENTFATEDISKEIFDNFQTGDITTTMHKWMNAPSVVDVYRELKNKLG